MEEPSVLDYLKAKLTPWRGQKIEIPPAEGEGETGSLREAKSPPAQDMHADIEGAAHPTQLGSSPLDTFARPLPGVLTRSVLPWRSLLAVILAIIAQLSLQPSPERTWQPGAFLYLLAGTCLAWAVWRGEWVDQGVTLSAADQQRSLVYRPIALLVSLALAVLAFLVFGGNRFTSFNVIVWVLALVAMVWGIWQRGGSSSNWWARLRSAFAVPEWRVRISQWSLLLLAAVGLVIFFRVYRIAQVPPEMVSDHAEKLLDIWDVLHGGTSIFFPRNTGREAIQMYLTAAIIQVFGTGFSFISLKIGTVLAGLLTLPYIYLLGKEFGNRRVALFAMLFAGIAYWPNVISRVGLRFPLYPLFVAPTLYYLLRGLRSTRFNDFILAGLALGIGLHGYTPIRILPFVVVVAVGMYLLHRQPKGSKLIAVQGSIALVFAAVLAFLPLLRYAVDNPSVFSYRSFTRLGTVEQPLSGPAGQIFLNNLWRAVTMFAWDDGEIWVHSVIHHPALDVVSAALFYLGAVLLVMRYARRRDWLDLFWLFSVPMLMLPSILSLAFPAENPALNRMAGAIVPVFLILGIALDGLLETIRSQVGGRWGSALAWSAGLMLLFWASLQNYDLVFNQYQDYYRRASWNSSEMGRVIRDFADSIGSPDTAWVLAYPYWVDTRLVGINAGIPTKDYAIALEALPETRADSRAKLFLVKPEDSAGLEVLRQLYPQEVLQKYTSPVEGHDFWMVFVPPSP
jgi:hypothetical protein